MTRESGKTIRAITSVTSIMLTAKVLAMLRNILQAHTFGAGADMDLFTQASNYTISIFSTVAYALCVAAVPMFSRRLAKGKDCAFQSANRLLSAGLLVSVAVSALLLLLNLFGFVPAFAGATGEPIFQTCFSCFLIALPIIVVTYLLLGLLQAMDHFNLQASLSLVYNLVLCAILLVVGNKLSLPVFSLITALAWILQLAILFPAARKEQFRFRLSLRFERGEFSHFIPTAIVTAITTSVFLLCYLLNAQFAAGIAEGAVSAYYYADRIFEPLATAVIYSIGIVMFPKFNQKYEQLQREEYCRYVSDVVVNSTLVLLPISLLLAVFGTPIVKVLFEGGSFDSAATLVTGKVFSAYALGTIGFFLLDLLSKAYFAMQKNRLPLIASFASLALCAATNFLFTRSDAPAVELLALGTSAALLCGGLILLIHFCRTHKVTIAYKRLLWGIGLSLLMAAALHAANTHFISQETSKVLLILQCGLLGLLGLMLYILLMSPMLPTKQLLHKLFRRNAK